MSEQPRRVRRPSTAVLVAAALAVAACAVAALNANGPRGPVILLWLPVLASTALGVARVWRTSQASWLPSATRSFWMTITGSGVLIFLGVALGAAYAVRDGSPGRPEPEPVPSLICYSAAVLLLLWALYRMPVAGSTRGARMRVWLDAATVALGAALFLVHFLHLRSSMPGQEYSGIWRLTLALTAIGAVAKVALSNDNLIDRVSLRLLATALLCGSLGTIPHPLLFGSAGFNSILYVVPAVFFFLIWAADRQVAADPADGSAPRRNPFVLLPYAAVLAVDTLLLVVVGSGRTENLWGVTVGAVLLTGLVVIRQVTAYQENGRLLAELHHGATHDALTQLPNRSLFAARLQASLSGSGGRPISVALVDLDSFKGINDALGHGTGDDLLISVGRRLAGCVTDRDTVARLGGDEFVVVLEGADATAADLTVERILVALGQPYRFGGQELLVTASIGITEGRTGDSASELLRQADVAMYAAKRQGGAMHLHYRPDMGGSSADHAHLGAELRQALGSDQFFLLYQPLVALGDGGLVGVEALVRWAHPVRGLVSPADFIPVAERTGLIVPLGRWVLRHACEQAVAWSHAYGDAAPAVMNVNMSARELREPDLPEQVAKILIETGLPPHRLVLEITETTVVALGGSVANLHALRDMGIRIALDDFGTGQSTLSLLQDCPVDELKLDRCFTQSDPAVSRDTMAVAVIRLAEALGLDTVAEGVETAQQADRLRDLGYEVVQGFYFARPLSADQLAQTLRVPGEVPASPL